MQNREERLIATCEEYRTRLKEIFEAVNDMPDKRLTLHQICTLITTSSTSLAEIMGTDKAQWYKWHDEDEILAAWSAEQIAEGMAARLLDMDRVEARMKLNAWEDERSADDPDHALPE